MGSLICRRSLTASLEADIILNGQYPGTFIGFATASSTYWNMDDANMEDLIEAGVKFEDNNAYRYYAPDTGGPTTNLWTTGEDKKVRVRVELRPTGGSAITLYDGWSYDTIINGISGGTNTDEYMRLWISLYYTGSVWEGNPGLNIPPTTPSNNADGKYLIFNTLRVSGTYQAHSLKVPMDLTGKIVDGYTGELWIYPHNFVTSKYHPEHGYAYNYENGVYNTDQPYISRPTHWLYSRGDGFGMATQQDAERIKFIAWVRIASGSESSRRRYYDKTYSDTITNYNVDPFDEPEARNKWWHFVTVWNKSTAKLNIYINGNGFEEFDIGEGYSPDGWDQYPSISFGTGTLLDISHLNWEADGLLDVVRLYDRALSEEEILQNFNASKWRYKDDMYIEGSTTS